MKNRDMKKREDRSRSELPQHHPVQPAGDPTPAARAKLPVTDKLLRKLKEIRKKDPNIYPLF